MHITGCIGAAAALFLCYTLLLVVRTEPWWEAQYFIPILGMLLGNAVSGASVGLTTLLEEFASGWSLRRQYTVASQIFAIFLCRMESMLFDMLILVGKDRVELLLAIGGSRWEATREAVSRSVRVACMPIINQMNVVGIVSIPGMMTGQILSGSDPSQVSCSVMMEILLGCHFLSVSF